MKKIALLSSLLLFATLTSNVMAQQNRTLTNGTSLNFVIGVPSSSFGSENSVESDYQYGALLGFNVGQRWYIKPQENYGFGVMAKWLDVAGTYKSGTMLGNDWTRAAFDISFLEVGPIGTYAINCDMAIDVYYNLRPTVLVDLSNQKYSTDDVTTVYSGFGLTHAIGTAFRWRILNVGVEYVAGSVTSSGSYNGSNNDLTLPDMDNKANSLRFLLGLKF